MQIAISGDLDEYRIAALVAVQTPIDMFGVGPAEHLHRRATSTARTSWCDGRRTGPRQTLQDIRQGRRAELASLPPAVLALDPVPAPAVLVSPGLIRRANMVNSCTG